MVHCTGGHAEIVTDGVGVQVDAENVEAIDSGFTQLLHQSWDPAPAVARARAFSPSVFDKAIKSEIRQLAF